MAIPFLNSIDLKDYQLLNAKMHVTSTAPTAAKGQIYLDSSDNILKYHNGTTWVSLVASTGGTVTSVSSATTGQLTVANGSTTPTLSIVTAPVSNGSSGLVTGDQVYDFVIGLGYLTSANAVTSFTATDGTFINLTPNTSQTGAATLTADLSATGTPDATVYLRGDNTWSPISGIPGTYDWTLSSDSGVIDPVTSGMSVTISGGTALSSSISGTTLTINHDSVSRTDTTSAASPSFGGTFTAVDSVTSNTQGHITALNLKTVTLPTPTDTNTTYDLTNTSTSGGSSINLVPSSGATDSITIVGTTSEVEVTHSSGSITIGLPNDVVIAGNLTVIGTTTTNNVETVSTSNGVIFEGNAADGNELTLLAGTLTADQVITLPDATGTIALTSNIGNGTLTVTAGTLLSGGGSFTANQSSNTSVTINHASVSRTNNTSTASPSFGGTFTAIDSITTSTEGHVTAVNTKTVTLPSNSANTYAATITDSAAVTHNLGTRDVIVQLFDVVTYETIYADVVRTSTTVATVTFGSTPTNSIRVLVSKIG
jgi:hypothetical protein